MFRLRQLIPYLRHIPLLGSTLNFVIQLLTPIRDRYRRRQYPKMFVENGPMLKPFGRIVPGYFLSKVKFLYPPHRGRERQVNGETFYEVKLILDRRFSHIRFCFSPGKEDPVITGIVFVFRNDRAAYTIKDAAMFVFGSRNCKPIMKWNVGEYRVIITFKETYRVENRPKRSRHQKSANTPKTKGSKVPKSHSRKTKTKKTQT